MSDILDDGGDLAFTRPSPYGTLPEPMFSGALSFMRREYSKDLAKADIAVWGIPFDIATTGRSGARFGPRGVRAASANLAWERCWPWKQDPFDKFAVIDYGDFAIDQTKPHLIPEKIKAEADKILASDTAMLSIGGDHFVTWPLLQAHAEKHGAPLALLHFDAHSDTWPGDDGDIDHGTMFYQAARRGIIDPKKSVQIGLRTTNDDPLGFNIIDARAVHASDPASIAQQVKEIIGDHKVYMTFDIDCLDPAFAPGTGTPVAGGLSSFQALEIIRNLQGLKIVGMDQVEVAPAYDHAEITALAGATIAMEMLCLYASQFDDRT